MSLPEPPRDPKPETRRDEMARAFDATFAEPPPVAAGETEDLLLVRAGSARLALRIAELSGLEQGRRVVPVPGSAPALVGLAGVRGRLVSVFSLGALLGTGAAEEDPRWFVLCGHEGEGGLAFSDLEGFARVPCSEIGPVHEGQGAGKHIVAFARAGEPRGVVDVRSVLAAAAAGGGEVVRSREA